MNVHQAAEAFRLFTGLEPDAGRMLRHFAEYVLDRKGPAGTAPLRDDAEGAGVIAAGLDGHEGAGVVGAWARGRAGMRATSAFAGMTMWREWWRCGETHPAARWVPGTRPGMTAVG